MIGSKGSVLFVDDDLDVLGLFGKLCALQLAGVSCVLAQDAAAALEAAKEQSFNVIVSDLDMPGMNGADLALQLRSGNPGAAIFLYSGKALPPDLPQDAFDQVFLKPVGLAALFQAISRILKPPAPA